MQKFLSIFSSIFFILLTNCALAGTTSLTSYYPPPTAAYNKVQLSPQASAMVGTPDCTQASNKGTLFVDSYGTLNICLNNQATVYPQECYNTFCSYNTVTDPNTTCSTFPSKTACPTGFQQMPMDSQSDYFEAFNMSSNVTVLSALCCSQGVTSAQTAILKPALVINTPVCGEVLNSTGTPLTGSILGVGSGITGPSGGTVPGFIPNTPACGGNANYTFELFNLIEGTYTLTLNVEGSVGKYYFTIWPNSQYSTTNPLVVQSSI